MKDPLYFSVLDSAVQKVNTNKASVCDPSDLVYYNQLPQFAFLNSDNTSLDFNYVPQMSGLMISRYGNILEVASKTNKIGMSLNFDIQRQSQVEGAELHLNPSTFLAAVLILGLAILLWWVLTTLTRKIFYLPKHGAWDGLQPSPSKLTWGNINSEFPNEEADLHVLNGVESKIQKQPDPKDNNSTANWENEKLIVELQKEQNDLYTIYWNNCTEDEKFFLYDLAEDGVVNRSDDEMLKSLSQKKLLRLYPRLEIVNVSFANFVRTTLPKDEIQKMEREESKDGRWKHTRVLLIIIIIAALAFLSIAEENFFGRATAIIGSITLVLPNLMTLFGSITKLFTKGSTASR